MDWWQRAGGRSVARECSGSIVRTGLLQRSGVGGGGGTVAGRRGGSTAVYICKVIPWESGGSHGGPPSALRPALGQSSSVLSFAKYQELLAEPSECTAPVKRKGQGRRQAAARNIRSTEWGSRRVEEYTWWVGGMMDCVVLLLLLYSVG